VVSRGASLLRGFKARLSAGGAGVPSIRHRGGGSPSTGLVALCVLLQLCAKVTAYGMGQALERTHGLQLMNAWPPEGDAAECYAAPSHQTSVNKRPPYTYFGKVESARAAMQACATSSRLWPHRGSACGTTLCCTGTSQRAALHLPFPSGRCSGQRAPGHGRVFWDTISSSTHSLGARRGALDSRPSQATGGCGAAVATGHRARAHGRVRPTAVAGRAGAAALRHVPAVVHGGRLACAMEASKESVASVQVTNI
jgi:hypothetical protein